MLSLVATARNRVLEAGRWAILLCLFSVPINKPATNIFIFLALVCALLGPQTRQRFDAAIRQPVVIGAILWFLAIFFSALIAPPGTERWIALGTYKALFYPLIVAMLLDTRQWRNRALFSFGLAVTLILVTSWIQFLIAIPQGDFAQTTTADSFTVFKNYTQQGIAFLVLAAMAACFANLEKEYKRKRILWIVAGFAFINVIYLLQSRTSYLIAVPLLLYWGWRLAAGQRSFWRGATIGLLLFGIVGAAAMLTPRFQQRIDQAKEDVSRYSTRGTPTSMGVRLELWKRTLPMIAAAPLFGHGLGQWANEFQMQVKDPGYNVGFLMGHPHQEELLILAEQGVIGFAAFVLVLIMLAIYIGRLEPPYRHFYFCLLLIYVTAGLANCILVDFSHRHIFLMLLACIPVVPVAARAQPVSVRA